MNYRTLLTRAILAMGILLTAFQAQADYTWVGTSSTAWTTSGNWTGASIPPTGDATPGKTNVNIRVNIQNAAASACYYTASQGYTVISNTGSGVRALVIGSTINGAMVISGGTLETRGSGSDVLGNASGANGVGSLTISGGNYITDGELDFPLNGIANTVSTLTINSGSASVKKLFMNQGGNLTGGCVLNLNGGTLSLGTMYAYAATWAGTNNFNGGVLRALSSTNIIQSTVKTLNVQAGGLIVDSAGFNIAIAPPLLNGGGTDGGVTKNGAGTLTLLGANTYNGPTIVNVGGLAVSSAQTGTGACTNSDGTTLTVAASGSSQWRPSTLSLGTNAGGGALEFTNLSSTSTAPLAPGTLVLNGNTTVNIRSITLAPGTYPLIAYTTLAGGGSLTLGTLPNRIGAYLNTSASPISLVVTSATQDIWFAGSGNWDTTSSNWKTNGVSMIFANGDPVLFDDTPSGAGPFTVTNTVSVSPASMTVSNASKNYTISGSAITGSTSLQKDGGGTLTLSNANTFSGGVTMKNGTLVLAGTNTYSGGTVVNGGTMILNATNAYSGSTVVNGGTLQVNAPNASSTSTVVGGGTMILAATNAYAGSMTVTGGLLRLATNSALPSTTDIALSGSGALDLAGFAAQANSITGTGGMVTNSSAAATLVLTGTSGGAVYNGSIGGPIGLTKIGVGNTVILGGNNTYTGVTTVNNEVLRATSSTALGAAGAGNDVTIINGARLELSGGISVAGKNLNLTGLGGNNFGGLQSFSGSNVWAGNVIVTDQTNSTRLGARAGAVLAISGVLSGSNTNALIIRNEADNCTVNLSGANTLTGFLNVFKGTLQCGAANTLPSGAFLTLGDGVNFAAWLDLNGYNQTVHGLNAAGGTNTGTVGNSSTTGDATLTISGSSSFAGVIQDVLGSGTHKVALTAALGAGGNLVLSGTNTFSGNTALSSGTLFLTAYGSISNTPNITLSAGTTLNVAGLTNSFVLGTSQTLTAGGSNSVSLKGNLNLGSGSLVLNYTNGTPALQVSGGAMLFSGNALTVTVSGTPLGVGSYVLVTTNLTGGSLAGTLPASVTVGGAGATGPVSLRLANNRLYLDVGATATVCQRTSGNAGSTYGDSLTFTATVTGNGNTPTGNVIFKDNGATLTTVALNGGSAVYTTTMLSAGSHSIAAYYQGNDNYYGLSDSSASPLSQSVAKATLTVTPNAVSIAYDGSTLGNAAYSQTTANYSITGWVNGEDIVSAGVTLSGSLAFNGATSTAVRNAGTYAQTAGSLALSANNYAMSFINATPNNYVITSRPITVTAVADSRVYDGTRASAGLPLASPAPVNGDTANFTQMFDTKDAGTGKTLTPSGSVSDGNSGNNYAVTFANNTSGEITPAILSGGLGSSPNPSLPGSNVTFTATFTNAAPDGPAAAGNVQFRLAGAALGDPVALDNAGLASLVTNSLPHGSNTVTAEYSVDINFSSITNSLVQVVNQAPVAEGINAGLTQGDSLVLTVVGGKYAVTDPDGDQLTLTAVTPTTTIHGGVVSIQDGTNVVYTASATYNGPDSFDYTVSDSYGATASATVTVNVAAAGATSNILSISSDNGIVTVRAFGIPGYTYRLQYITDLNNAAWQDVPGSAVTAGVRGAMTLVDTNPPSGQCYYRTKY